MTAGLRCEMVNQHQVYELCWGLAQRISASGYRPEILVAISRGGFVPARYLCDFLDISAMTSIKVQHYGPGAKKQRRAWVKYPLSGQIEDRRVLLVDDVNDTGDTLLVATEHLRSFAPTEVRTAVVHEKLTTTVAADYREVQVSDWHWIIYPWAIFEDVGSFLGQMAPAASDPADARQRLSAEHGIHMDDALVARVLEFSRQHRDG